MKRFFVGIALFASSPTIAQAPASSSAPASATSSAAPAASNNTPRWLSNWDGAIELALRPTIGEPIGSRADDNLIDDSEFELAVRARRPLGNLNSLRLQLQAGVTSTPNLLDADNAESAYYGELQLGDTYLAFSDLRRGDFSDPVSGKYPAAFRPYARYRASSIHQGLVDAYVRTDHRATVGLRYRRVPFIVRRTYTEDGVQQPVIELPGFFFEVRAEATRVWSTLDSETLWNPRLQLDLYSPPFWNGTRFVVKATGEVNIYDDALAPSGDERRDTRLRLVAGLDLSEPLTDWLNARAGTISAELLGRFQARWSNDPAREHTRLYFVPSVTFTIPL